MPRPRRTPSPEVSSGEAWCSPRTAGNASPHPAPREWVTAPRPDSPTGPEPTPDKPAWSGSGSDKLKEIRDALDDDAVFNVVGEVLPAAQVERVLRDYYAGRLGQEDLEDRLLRAVDEESFRSICQTALEGLASRTL